MIAVLCALMSGAGFYLAFNLGDVWWLAWLAPVPVLWFAHSDSRSWVAFLVCWAGPALGALNALPAYGGVMPVFVLAMMIALPALMFAGSAMLSRRVTRAISPLAGMFCFAAVWAAFDFLTSFAHDGAIISPANSQVLQPVMIQSASLFGPYAITFAIGFFASGVAMALAKKQALPAMAAVSMLALILAFGTWRMAEPQGETVRVGLATDDSLAGLTFTPKIDDARRVIAKYVAAAHTLAAQGAKLIVFPEKTVMLSPERKDDFLGTLQHTADELHATIVFGFHEEENGGKLNTARVFVPGKPVQRYLKRHFVTGIENGYTAGPGPLALADGTGIEICKDMDYPAMLRRDSNALHTTLLAAPAWDFGTDRIYHARPAILRGVEEGFGLARTAKEGLLTLTDSTGRMIGMKSGTSSGMVTLIGDLPRGTGHTLYQRIGDVFGWLCVMASLAVACFLAFRRKM